MSMKHESIGMAGAAELYHDLKARADKMEALLSDCRDQLDSMVWPCGCSRPDVCHACRVYNDAQELVNRINELTGENQ